MNLEGTPRKDDPRRFSAGSVVIGNESDRREVRNFLFRRTLCPSSHDLRLLAAGVLVGQEADRAAMRVLADGFMRAPNSGTSRAALREAEFAAQTERALPLWRTLLDDNDSSMRLWATRNLGAVQSKSVLSLLIVALKDDTYSVRKEAALILMARDARESVPVLKEILNAEYSSTVEEVLPLMPIFRALTVWGVEDLPWQKVEAFMTADAKQLPYKSHVLHLAGECLLAGRERVARPFLEEMYGYGWRDNYTRMHATHVLAAGESIGARPLIMYVEDCADLDALKALGDFTLHSRCNPADREAIFKAARHALDRSAIPGPNTCSRPQATQFGL